GVARRRRYAWRPLGTGRHAPPRRAGWSAPRRRGPAPRARGSGSERKRSLSPLYPARRSARPARLDNRRMTNPYPIPARTTRIENVVVNSRFIATAARADSVDEAKAFIQSIRAEMPDATHHVYAFKIGYGGSIIEGMSDDGEPSGTSGPPVLAVLRGAEIGDI